MSGIFSLLNTISNATAIGHAINSSSDNFADCQAIREYSHNANKVLELEAAIKTLQDNLGKAMLINEALWEIIRDKHQLTEKDLYEKLYDIDMRDGKLDGKNQRNTPVECPNCHHKIAPHHDRCMYCGEAIDKSVFEL